MFSKLFPKHVLNLFESGFKFFFKRPSRFFFKFFSFLGNREGVSVIFGALLLLAIFAVFMSAFLITAVPTKIMISESEDSSRLASDILRFSEQNYSAGCFSFQTAYTTVFADESSDQILFMADLTIPPESKKFLKKGSCPPFLEFSGHSNNLLQSADVYCLSSGSLLFLSKYSQIPDSVYSIGASSILLIQDDGFSFLKSPDFSFHRGINDKILLTIYGNIIKSNSSSVFGNRTYVHSFTVQSSEIYDSVYAVAFQYVPGSNEVASVEKTELKTEAFRKWLSQFENESAASFPEIKIETDIENLTVYISSEMPFDINIIVQEIEYNFSSGF